jgi:hypothetical protein
LFAVGLPCGCGRSDADSPSVGRKQPASATQPADSQASPSLNDAQAGVRASSASRQGDWFVDVTARSGIDFSYRNGEESQQFTILETVGGGVAMIDYDNDDDLDLFFPGGGRISASPLKIEGLPSRLYRNDGSGKFVDVTQEAGLSSPGDYSHGCTVADFDRDGFSDLFVTCYGRNRLFRNDGRGHFEEVGEKAGIAGNGWGTAAAWGDVDRDGWPDLFVANYLDWTPAEDEFCGTMNPRVRDVCPPQKYPAAANRLYRNRGDGRFEDISHQAGINELGKGLGVVAADVNDDGWLDFYLANDVLPNRLYLGGPDLKFTEAGTLSGVALNEYGAPEGSMGVDFGDYNGDGLGDLWVTNFEMEDNSLYRNDGRGAFTHATVVAGLAGRCKPYVGFGTGFADFDSDGWLDLFVINGHVFYRQGRSPYRQPAFLFHNRAGMAFADVSHLGGDYFSSPHPGRGAAVGDLDNDGAPDLVIVHQNERISVLRNLLQPARWVRFKLQGTRCDRDAVGAKVTLRDAGRELIRWAHSGAGYLSQFDPRIVFPVSENWPGEVEVVWPGKRREIFRQLSPGQTNVLVEGEGERP